MDCKLIVGCQYFENYNVGPEGFGEVPHWKPKGGHEFEIEVNSDVLLYSNDLVKHLTKMVEAQSTIAEKFEYRDHELKWSEPSVLSTEKLYELINNENE
jgi:hypothetical protein